MSQETAFSFAGWIGLLTGIWFLFEKSEKVVSATSKTRITLWLKNLDPTRGVSNWPDTFAQVFDSLFGEHHFSWKCFRRSSVASIASAGIVTLTWGALRPNEVNTFLNDVPSFLVVVGFMLVFFTGVNLLPDYLSLLETRWPLARFSYRPHDREAKTPLPEVPKVKNKKQSIPRLRRGASAEEIIGWTEKYDVFDRLDAGVSEVVKDHSDLDLILQEALFQGNTAQLNMRIPPAMKAVLSRLARQRTTDATTLARIWLAERLRQEIAHD